MSYKKYTADDHRRAFEVFYATRTYARVQDEIGIDFTTVKAWEGHYMCPEGCPWHNWELLERERSAALAAKLSLYNDNNYNVVEHEQAMKQAVQEVRESSGAVVSTSGNTRVRNRELAARQAAIDSIVRSDVERLSHWEYLYSKVYYSITGMALDHQMLMQDGKPLSAEAIAQQLGRGVGVRTLDAGIRALADVQKHINELKEQLGVYKKPTEPADGQPSVRSLTIDDVRQMKSLMSNSTPEQLAVIQRLMASEESAYENLAVHDGE